MINRQTIRSYGIPLQPLQIPAGWTVEWNSFYAIDPDTSLEQAEALGLIHTDQVSGTATDRDHQQTTNQLGTDPPDVHQPVSSNSNQKKIDLWQDILSPFFDSSCLWRGHRNDYACEITLEWAPQGDRDGYYWLTEGRSRSITFAKRNKKRIRRSVENIELCYRLEPPVDWLPGFTRELESRSRPDIVDTLNQWLNQSLEYRPPHIRANQVR